jgi:hypothetical protein
LAALDFADCHDVCRRVLAVVAPHAVRLEIDGFSDVRELSVEEQSALAVIQQLAPMRRLAFRQPEKTYMAITVDWTVPGQKEMTEAYVPLSIHAVLSGAQDAEIATFHDSGKSVSLDLSDELAERVAAALPGNVTLERLSGGRRK